MKVGDKFRRVKTDVGSMYPNFIAGYEGVVDRVYGDTVWDNEGRAHTARNIELISDSPIRTVTRREIVPGVYGQVVVGKHATPGWIDIRWPAPGTTSSELRDAARIFNEIADVLDEQKEAA